MCDRWEEYWVLLERQLAERHGARVVHNVAETRLLAKSFPDEISLLSATVDGVLVVGAVLYETPTVVHAQYLGANEASRRFGLLDLVLENAIAHAQAKGKCFDFGISTRNNSKY